MLAKSSLRAASGSTRTAFPRSIARRGVVPARLAPCAVSPKEFVEELAACPGPKRYICVGGGGILESVATAAVSFTDVPAKGTLATFSNDDRSFEAHLYLDDLFEARLVKGTAKKGDHSTYVCRMIGSENKVAMTVMLAGGASPDATGVAAFEALLEKHGELVILDNVDGDAMFSFSDN